MAPILWPPPTPLLEQLGIPPGPGIEQRVMAGVDAGTIHHLEVGTCLELRFEESLTNNNQ